MAQSDIAHGFPHLSHNKGSVWQSRATGKVHSTTILNQCSTESESALRDFGSHGFLWVNRSACRLWARYLWHSLITTRVGVLFTQSG